MDGKTAKPYGYGQAVSLVNDPDLAGKCHKCLVRAVCGKDATYGLYK
jgi:hypothetical protein